MDELLLLMQLIDKNHDLLEELSNKEVKQKETKSKEKNTEETIMSRDKDNHKPEHFNDSYAKYIVSKMHHSKEGCKYIGEIYDMNKAADVYMKYKDCISKDITIPDVYVAINSQYHDYSNMFEDWYMQNIDCKIIDSAIIFWFKDEDYTKGFKLWNYFCM